MAVTSCVRAERECGEGDERAVSVARQRAAAEPHRAGIDLREGPGTGPADEPVLFAVHLQDAGRTRSPRRDCLRTRTRRGRGDRCGWPAAARVSARPAAVPAVSSPSRQRQSPDEVSCSHSPPAPSEVMSVMSSMRPPRIAIGSGTSAGHAHQLSGGGDPERALGRPRASPSAAVRECESAPARESARPLG